jgi:hypothetical protein
MMNFLSFLEVLLIAKGQKQAMNSWKKADLVRWEIHPESWQRAI